MSVIVDLTTATICFMNACYPAIVGKAGLDTPPGEYRLEHRSTTQKGYGGDILQYHETSKVVYAVHRVWTLNPAQKRVERLQSPNPKDRFVSAGCINVMPDVYDKLVECCKGATLIIKK
jgi:hypothetical protein